MEAFTIRDAKDGNVLKTNFDQFCNMVSRAHVSFPVSLGGPLDIWFQKQSLLEHCFYKKIQFKPFHFKISHLLHCHFVIICKKKKKKITCNFWMKSIFQVLCLFIQCRVSGNATLQKTPWALDPRALWEERASILNLPLIQTLITHSKPDQPHSTPYQTRTEWKVFKWVWMLYLQWPRTFFSKLPTNKVQKPDILVLDTSEWAGPAIVSS